jgi:hypothetical protein
MARGLFWLPLLALFIWLAWAGWNEYQKLEAYRIWAEPFDHAKYDIYSVLGQKGSEVTWGKPSRQGPTHLQTFSLEQVKAIQVMAGDRSIDLTQPPDRARKVSLAFQFTDAEPMIQIPFTDLALALQWAAHFQQYLSDCSA